LARAIVVRVNPVPRGCVAAPVTKTRVPRDTKTPKPYVENTKRLRRVLDLSYDSWGLVEMNVPQVVEEI
jgi:hypothetical protein